MPQPDIRIDRVGREGTPVVVVENLSPDPEALIAAAQATAFTPIGPYYPGVRAPVGPEYFAGMGQVLAAVLRDVFGAHEHIAFNRAFYSLATTPPDQLTLPQRAPHIDGTSPALIAMIHYLSPTDQGGTAFHRHRSTGFETISQDRHRSYLDALSQDFERLGEPAPGYIQGSTPIFDEIAAYDGPFNRALIYPSRLLHCARLPNDAALSDDPKRGRLTVASFMTIR